MRKNNINAMQVGSLIICIIMSMSMGIGIFNALEFAKIDSYIAIIISTILGFIPVGIILYIANYKPNLNIVEKINFLFGKPIGFLVNFIISLIIMLVAITSLFSISNFIVSQFLSNTPVIYIGIALAILNIFALNKGIETITRSSLILMMITIAFFIFLIAGLIPEFKTDNLKPILEYGINKPLIASLITICVNVVPLFLILIIPKDNIVDKKNYNKFIIIAYIIASLITIIIITLTMGVLGQYLADLYQYPEYIVLRKITLFDFIDRIENLICIQWISSTFITSTLCFYYICNNIKKEDKPKKLAILIVAIAILLSLYIFKNNTTFNIYISKIYPYILAFMFLLLLITAIIIFIRRKTRKGIN